MKTRIVAGILAGIVTLWMIFYLILMILALTWPAVRDVGTQVMESEDYSGLTLPMLLVFLGMWSLSYLGAGWMTVKIAKQQRHALIAVTPFFLFAAWNHLYAMWEHFPWWYNFLVVLPVYPLAWAGGKLVRPGSSSK